MPLQYAVALKARRAPGAGSAVASRRTQPARRVLRVEARHFVQRRRTPPTATAVTSVFRQNEPEMIIASSLAGGDGAIDVDESGRAACHEGERSGIGDRGDARSRRSSSRRCTARASGFRIVDQLLPELAVKHRQLEQRRDLRLEARRARDAASAARRRIVTNA